jgi:hypothetical protein
LIPVVTARGGDVSRSAAGRLAGELILTPAAALAPQVRWTEDGRNGATAAVDVDGRIHEVTISVSASGTLESVRLMRWGDPDRTGFAWHQFTAVCAGERRFDGFGVPAHTRAGWGAGGVRDFDGAFIDFVVDGAVFH